MYAQKRSEYMEPIALKKQGAKLYASTVDSVQTYALSIVLQRNTNTKK